MPSHSDTASQGSTAQCNKSCIVNVIVNVNVNHADTGGAVNLNQSGQFSSDFLC